MRSSINIGGFTAYFEGIDEENVITITEITGNDSRMTLPDFINQNGRELIIKRIGKKAFMGLKQLKAVSLPGTVEMLDDWSFAHCSHLKELVIRPLTDENVNIDFGKGVFEGCNELSSICIGYEESDDKAMLLSAAIWRLPASYLFKDPDIGTPKWCQSWDKSLKSYLEQNNDEGYTDRVLCGEEDISYDGIASVDGELLSDGTNFVRETIMRKCYLCFLRLKASEYLEEEYRNIFIDYLNKHGKGTKGEEAWSVLKDYFGDNIEYFKLYEQSGCLQNDKIDEMLEDLGETHAEAKAFLIKHKQSSGGESAFFSDMFL